MMIVVYADFVVQILVLTERVEVNGVNDGSVSTAVEVAGAVESGILGLDGPVERGAVPVEGSL